MRKQLRIAKTTRSIGHSLLAVAVASCICMPLTATAAETDTPLTATGGNDSSDAPIAVTLERTNEAPAATEEFFIEDDGTALTWDEFCAKYYNEDEEADDAGHLALMRRTGDGGVAVADPRPAKQAVHQGHDEAEEVEVAEVLDVVGVDEALAGNAVAEDGGDFVPEGEV